MSMNNTTSLKSTLLLCTILVVALLQGSSCCPSEIKAIELFGLKNKSRLVAYGKIIKRMVEISNLLTKEYPNNSKVASIWISLDEKLFKTDEFISDPERAIRLIKANAGHLGEMYDLKEHMVKHIDSIVKEIEHFGDIWPGYIVSSIFFTMYHKRVYDCFPEDF